MFASKERTSEKELRRQVDAALEERDAAILERDMAITERDKAVAERDAVANEAKLSTKWMLAPRSRLPSVEIVPDNVLRRSRATSLNRLCNLRDWEPAGMLSPYFREMREDVTIHRKPWEYSICMHGLQQLGCVTQDASAISVGAGYEKPLFYYANHIKKMVATDLYDNPGAEGQPGMLTATSAYAPFPYREDHLEVLQMSGTDLKFPDETFDFAFTLSSIEHFDFGNRHAVRSAFDEIIRVVKPGGKICIITELILNGARHRECFTPAEIEEIFLSHKQASVVGGEFDLRIQKSLMDYPVTMQDGEYTNISPHIVIDAGGPIITSLSMFFERLD